MLDEELVLVSVVVLAAELVDCNVDAAVTLEDVVTAGGSEKSLVSAFGHQKKRSQRTYRVVQD